MTEKGDRTGDIFATIQHPAKTCWFCKQPHATSVTKLGGTSGAGTRINICGPGEGCQDGRIFHGPQGRPHRPDEDCTICGPAGTAKARRATNRAPRTPKNRDLG